MYDSGSLQSQAYNTIKEQILSKSLDSDVLYSETRLAKELGISRTPPFGKLFSAFPRMATSPSFPAGDLRFAVLIKKPCVSPLKSAVPLKVSAFISLLH